MSALQSMTQPQVLWLPSDLLSLLAAEADRTSPLETGGVLLGYLAESGKDFVVTSVLGPGPDAVHERHRFSPDHPYQLQAIEQSYHESGRVLEYLGDWHTHPKGIAELSSLDLATLRRIAAFKHARISSPVMLVLAPGPEWNPKAWCGTIVRHLGIGRKLKPWPLRVNVFDRDHPSMRAE
jgi:integrative and conjugative element protein (TIGR02256 family)